MTKEGIFSCLEHIYVSLHFFSTIEIHENMHSNADEKKRRKTWFYHDIFFHIPSRNERF